MQDRIAIILVRPQMGENIGAAARAMANFGLCDLRIVNPRDGWPNQRALDMASGAFDHIPAPRIFETIQEACADLNKTYATTARSRDMVKPVLTPNKAVEDGIGIVTHDNAKIGFVFGPERTGLENDELNYCSAIINVPTNAAFSSLNLAQCVLLICYTLSDAYLKAPEIITPMGDSAPVSQDKLEEFLTRMDYELDQAGFFKSDGLHASMKRNIRNMFIRNNLSDQEVKTLHGVVTALIKKRDLSDS